MGKTCRGEARSIRPRAERGTGFVAVFVALLLAVTMMPAAGVQTALADEQFAVDGLMYKAVDGGAVLVGFEDGGALDENVTVPEKVSEEVGELTVVGVDITEGQVAPNVKALTLPQTVTDVNTKSLAAALPGLASVNVDGTAGAYSSANGLLFRQADEAASSDGSTVRVANRELLWTPPATVIARIPGTCKHVAAGAFTDAKALETIMAFSTVESIARPEKDSEGNVVKEGAFNDEQVSRVNIVIPISATVQSEGAERISTDVFLSEQVGLDVKQTPWCDYGFDIKRFTVGIPCGSTSVTVAVPEDGVVETPVITVGDYVGYPQWNPKPGEVDWPANGLVFEYKADMTVSVRWDGDKNAIPSHLELPAYVVENGVKTAVTEVAPSAFEGAAQLESVVIPEGVTTIGESAFAGCSGLKSVELPSTLKTIDYAAFKGVGLESVEIPSAVRWIGGEAFAECESLTTPVVSGGSVISTASVETDGSEAQPVSDQSGQDGIAAYADPATVIAGQASGNMVTLQGYKTLTAQDYGWVDGTPDEEQTFSVISAITPNSNVGRDTWVEFSWMPTHNYWQSETHIKGVHNNILYTCFKNEGSRTSRNYEYLKLLPAEASDSNLRLLYQFYKHTGTTDQTAYDTGVKYGSANALPVVANEPIPYLTDPGKFYLAVSAGLLIHYGVTYEGIDDTTGLRTEFNVEDGNKHLADPAYYDAVNQRVFLGWTGPGNPDTPKFGKDFDIDVSGVSGENLTYTAHWEPVSQLIAGQKTSGNVTLGGYETLAPTQVGYIAQDVNGLDTEVDPTLDEVTSKTQSPYTNVSHVNLTAVGYRQIETHVKGVKDDELYVVFEQRGHRGNNFEARYLKLDSAALASDQLRLLYRFVEHEGTYDHSAEASIIGYTDAKALPATPGTSIPYEPGKDGVFYLEMSAALLKDLPITYDGTCDGFADSLLKTYTVEDTGVHLADPADGARPGYRFIGWTGPGNDTGSPQKGADFEVPASTNPDGLSYTAVWEHLDVNIALSAGERGGVGTLTVSDAGAYQKPAGEDAYLATLSDDKAKLAFSGRATADITVPHSVWARLEADGGGNATGKVQFYPTLQDANDRTNIGATLSIAPDNGYELQEWTYTPDGDTTKNVLLSTATPVEITNTSDRHALRCTFKGKKYSISYMGGGGTFPGGSTNSTDTVGYQTGAGKDALDKTCEKPGFWLKGWVWTNESANSVYSGSENKTEPTFSIPTEAYGNAVLKPVWEPKIYRAVYNTPPTAGKPDLGSTDLVHKDAVKYVNDELAPDSLQPAGGDKNVKMAVWDKAYTAQPGYSKADSDSVWVDTTGVSDAFAARTALAGSKGGDLAKPDADDNRLEISGYTFQGWCADSAFGTDAKFDTDVPEGTTKTVDADNMADFFASVWDGTTTKPAEGVHAMDVYGVWTRLSLDDNVVALWDASDAKANEPTDTNNERGEGGAAVRVSDVDGKAATAGTTKVYYWQGHGLLSEAEKAEMDADPSVGTGMASRKGDTSQDTDIDADMGLVAPTRYGFEFRGWGTDSTDPSSAYISYDENVGRVGGGAGFKITKKGAELMSTDPASLSDNDWKPIWERRTIEVSLRIPAHAVSDVDRDGASTGKDRGGVEGSTTYQYTFAADEGEAAAAAGSEAGATYAWREGTAAETGNGATSGWLIAKRTWGYYDLLEYPAFSPQKDRYTYDGWYDAAKPSTTDSTDKALADNPGVRELADFESLRQPNRYLHVTGESGADETGRYKGLDIPEAFFLTGDTSGFEAGHGVSADEAGSVAREMWLWASPVRINVAAPVGVYLCTTNSYGQAVEPYVVGNDRRTQLEAQAEFQVSESSHDLQLVSVTAEDVTSFEYEKDESGTENVDRPDTGTVDATAGASGFCDQILNPKNASASTTNDAYDGDSTRMFWVSPVPTATADQTGVIYKASGDTAATAAEKVDAAADMADAEKALRPDVESRRYFGFASADNKIEDSLAGTSDGSGYRLDGFVLRQDGSGGLARTSHDEASGASTYRFYYGLDMRRAEFDLTGLQEIIDRAPSDGLEYNSAFTQPLLRLKFTFAAARTPGISYYSMALADDGEAARAGAYDAAAEAAASGIDESTVVTVGAPTA